MNGDFTQKLKVFFIQYSIVCAMFVAVVVFCFIDPTLISVRNIRNIFSDLAPLVIASIGVALCFFTGHMDITSGVLASFAGLIAGSFMQRMDLTARFFSFGAASAFIIIPLIVILFSLFGALYAFIVAKTKIHIRIFSLASIVLLLGVSHVYASYYNFDTLEIAGFTDQFLSFGAGYVGSSPANSIPFTVITSIIVVIAVFVYFKFLKLDFNKIGMDDSAKSFKNLNLFYMPATALFALAGIMIAARNNVATPTFAINLSTETITICLIAGLSLKNNRGNLIAVIITSFLYAALMYCVKFIGLNSYLTIVIQGLLFMGAVFLDYFISIKKTA